MKVLIVDDEVRYRDYLSQALTQCGHETETAESGHAGVEAGLRFQPDVLVADWLLKNDLHGLQVSEVLRTVVPNLRTILITGFPSRDLEEEADQVGVFRLLQKPFDLEQFLSTVEEAVRQPPKRPSAHVGMLEVDEKGHVVGANATATAQIGATWPTLLTDIFDSDSASRLDACATEWTILQAKARPSRTWIARSRPLDSYRLFVLLDEDDRALAGDPFVEQLLGIRRHRPTWPFPFRVLVIDDSQLIRRLIVEQLENSGVVCYKADTRDLALQILAADEDIGAVVIDFSMPGIDVPELAQAIRSLRPGVRLIGNSLTDNRRAFEAFGVSRFLLKPWTTQELVELLGVD